MVVSGKIAGLCVGPGEWHGRNVAGILFSESIVVIESIFRPLQFFGESCNIKLVRNQK